MHLVPKALGVLQGMLTREAQKGVWDERGPARGLGAVDTSGVPRTPSGELQLDWGHTKGQGKPPF